MLTCLMCTVLADLSCLSLGYVVHVMDHGTNQKMGGWGAYWLQNYIVHA